MKEHGDASLVASLIAFAGWVTSHLADINAWLQFLVLVVALISGSWALYIRWKHRHR